MLLSSLSDDLAPEVAVPRLAGCVERLPCLVEPRLRDRLGGLARPAGTLSIVARRFSKVVEVLDRRLNLVENLALTTRLNADRRLLRLLPGRRSARTKQDAGPAVENAVRRSSLASRARRASVASGAMAGF